MELSRRCLPLPAQVLSCSSSVQAATGSLPGFSSRRGRAVATEDKLIPPPASARWQRAPARRCDESRKLPVDSLPLGLAARLCHIGFVSETNSDTVYWG